MTPMTNLLRHIQTNVAILITAIEVVGGVGQLFHRFSLDLSFNHGARVGIHLKSAINLPILTVRAQVKLTKMLTKDLLNAAINF